MMMLTEFLDLDVRNNSLWNHRWFVVTKLLPLDELPKKLLLREMEFALKHIPKVHICIELPVLPTVIVWVTGSCHLT